MPALQRLSSLKPCVELIQDAFLAAQHCNLGLEMYLPPPPKEDDSSSESSSDLSEDEEPVLHFPLWIHEILHTMATVGVRPWYQTQQKLEAIDLVDRFAERMDFVQCHLELIDRAAQFTRVHWTQDRKLYRRAS